MWSDRYLELALAKLAEVHRGGGREARPGRRQAGRGPRRGRDDLRLRLRTQRDAGDGHLLPGGRADARPARVLGQDHPRPRPGDGDHGLGAPRGLGAGAVRAVRGEGRRCHARAVHQRPQRGAGGHGTDGEGGRPVRDRDHLPGLCERRTLPPFQRQAPSRGGRPSVGQPRRSRRRGGGAAGPGARASARSRPWSARRCCRRSSCRRWPTFRREARRRPYS